ncbi:hypothetical protein FJTKL_03433 [Diaporthe vaccinii]|uniref:Uncharacterized protein n=1 Tax=Diaporthe vaccinii TaxID=105482 RepID=A0ABR4F261_9PEZI
MASSLSDSWSLSLDTLVATTFGFIGALSSLANLYFAWRQLTVCRAGHRRIFYRKNTEWLENWSEQAPIDPVMVHPHQHMFV